MSEGVERSSLLAGGTRTRLIQAGPEDATEAVVFVHGNPGSADDWERLVGAAGALGMRAIAFDLPDFGETIAPDGFEHDLSGYAAFLGEALRELGIERVHLVIHDFGGPIGLVWAMANPDAVISITLIDTGLMPGYRWHSTARVWRTPVAGEALQAVAIRPLFRFLITAREPRGLPREFVEGMYDHYDRRTRRAVLKLYRATPDPGGMSENLIGLFRPRDIPALVIWGEDDPYLSSSYAPQQREAFPRPRSTCCRPAATGPLSTHPRPSSACSSNSSGGSARRPAKSRSALRSGPWPWRPRPRGSSATPC